MTERVLRNRERYNRMARVYEALVRFGSFGQFARFHGAVAAEVEPCPGGVILDLGCGLGSLVPYLLPRVGAAGTVIGVDVSDRLIERARENADRAGWHHVEFVRADVREFAPQRTADAAVFCLSLTAMPEPVRCLARALSWLRPGGQLVVLDSFPQRSRPLARWVIHANAPFVGAEPSERPLQLLLDQLDDLRTHNLHLGVYTLVSGRKRS